MPDPAARVARARTKMSTARDRVQEDVAAFGLAVAESEDLAQVVYNSSSKDGKKKIDEVFGRKNGKKSDTEGDEETGGSKKADSNLVKKVKQLKASGKSKGKIEDVLLKKGESPKAIDKAVAAVFKK